MLIVRWCLAFTLVSMLVACGDPLAAQGPRGGSGTGSPVVVLTAEADGSTVELAFGQSVIVEDLGVPMNDVYIESEDTAIVYPVQPSDGEGIAGLVAVGEGATRVTVWESFPTGKAQAPVITVQIVVAARQDPDSR